MQIDKLHHEVYHTQRIFVNKAESYIKSKRHLFHKYVQQINLAILKCGIISKRQEITSRKSSKSLKEVFACNTLCGFEINSPILHVQKSVFLKDFYS